LTTLSLPMPIASRISRGASPFTLRCSSSGLDDVGCDPPSLFAVVLFALWQVLRNVVLIVGERIGKSRITETVRVGRTMSSSKDMANEAERIEGTLTVRLAGRTNSAAQG